MSRQHHFLLRLALALPASVACGSDSSDATAVDDTAAQPSDAARNDDGTLDGADGRVTGDTGGPASDTASPSDGTTPPTGEGLAAKYPRDEGIEKDPAVIFHSDFESDLAGWTDYIKDPARISVVNDAATAHAGNKYLSATVTKTMLKGSLGPYVAAAAQYRFARTTDTVYWRYHVRFVGKSAPPHHWVRLAAGNASYDSDGLANTVPPGNGGFWFDFDGHDDGLFDFYAYWYKMRSGRCNDGTAVPGCAGDQGTTYYYGNNFSPAGQAPFPRDAWFCVELMAKANTVGKSDGAVSYWKDDALVGAYEPGKPHGRWLRDNFFTWGPYYADEGAFAGFDWRSSPDVHFKKITLDAYYELGSLTQREKDLGVTFPEAQQILYDDVVVATERIGCRTK